MNQTSPKEKRILCLIPEKNRFDSLWKYLSANGYFVYDYTDPDQAKAHIYNEPPDMIFLSSGIHDWEHFLIQMKQDPVYGHLPVLIFLEPAFSASLLTLSDLPCDDLVHSTNSQEEILLRVRLREVQGNRYLDANPLTRLPGNFSIMNNIQSCIDSGSPFAFCYSDIDNFKAFNDSYGFARGDDMIRMTGRILTNVVKRLAPDHGFVGHVGGDDFVFIVSSDTWEECCRQILQSFDLVAPTFANDSDRARGFIETEDRQGALRRFPLPSLSIAAIDAQKTPVTHPGAASTIASELKKQVKKLPGSNYMLNRRMEKKQKS